MHAMQRVKTVMGKPHASKILVLQLNTTKIPIKLWNQRKQQIEELAYGRGNALFSCPGAFLTLSYHFLGLVSFHSYSDFSFIRRCLAMLSSHW